ncbi:MAG: single-stranded DNA-binding protein [Myxococcota bacterium]
MFVLSGNLGAPPEERSSDTGRKVCSFRIANNRWDSKKKVEVADWYTVYAFGPVAENCMKYLDKGSSVVVEGRAVQKEWEKDGKTNRTIEVLANRVSFFGPARRVAAEAAPAESGEVSVSEAVPF